MRSEAKAAWALAFVAFLAALFAAVPAAGAAAPKSKNMLPNPSFEMGRMSWRMDKDGATSAEFTVDAKDVVDGQYSALVKIGAVAGWGTQFGQSLGAGERGKTYTFAVVAKAVGEPVTVDLEIERSGKPYDRAARGGKVTLPKDKWTELHVTFQVEKDFPDGWFAYLSCTQANCQYRADLFRLYEGPYVPYKEVAPEEAATAGPRLYDTGAAAAAPLPPDALANRPGWTLVPADAPAHKFAGDTVLMNDALAVVLRAKGHGAELYALGSGSAKLRATLVPVGEARADKLLSVAVAPKPKDKGGAARQGLLALGLDAAFTSGGGTAGDKPAKTLAVRFELSTGQAFVKTLATGGVTALRVEAPCRFAVMPDFFADDIVLDARESFGDSFGKPPLDQAEIPTDNFLLHLVGNGEAIVANVWGSREEDVRLNLAGKGDARTIAASEIQYGKDLPIWVAVLEWPSVWHKHEVQAQDGGKVVPMDWRPPFGAQWRVDWHRADGLTDSWEMVVEDARGGYVKYDWTGGSNKLPANRRRWTTVLGTFAYPCWIDRSGRGWLQPLPNVLRFQGPAIVYPIERAGTTPLTPYTIYTIVDLMRATLGVGPCQFILDVQNQQTTYKGRATCANRDTLNPIYAKGQQKQRRSEIERSLREVIVFIHHIRGRIEGYVDFGHEMLGYLAEQKSAHPDLAKHLDELAALTREIDARVARRKESIKTPAYAEKLVEEFRRTLLDYQGPDALAQCKKFTSAWVEIGSNQDELVGECRWAVKVLRQRAGLLTAADPRLGDVAKEIRRRSQIALRNPSGHESPRH